MANTFRLRTKSNLQTSLADVYTASSVTTIVVGMTICNRDSSSRTVDVKVVTDTSSNADVYLLKGAPVPSGGSLEVMSGNKLVLETTDKIQALASVADKLDVVLSIMEIS